MDARGDSTLRVSGELEQLKERLARLPLHLHFTGAGRIAASGSRPAGDSDIPERGGLAQLTHAAGGYLHTCIPPASAESRLAAHALPGHGRRPGAAG